MIQADIIDEANRILDLASEKKITLRLLGGVGIRLSCPSMSKPEYSRSYNDIDFMGLRKQSRNIENLFKQLDYVTKGMFNVLEGDRRLKFFDEKYGRRIDVFLDKFAMCHEFGFKDRLEICDRTLCPADLLLTKLQIVELNKKDIFDAIAIIVDHTIGRDSILEIDMDRIIYYTASDWGIYRTLTINLEKIFSLMSELSIPEEDKRTATDGLEQIRKMIDSAPKSLGWKMRAKIGDKMKWYDLPERV